MKNVYVVSWQDEDGIRHARWVYAENENQARQQGYALSLGSFVRVHRTRFVPRVPALRLAA